MIQPQPPRMALLAAALLTATAVVACSDGTTAPGGDDGGEVALPELRIEVGDDYFQAPAEVPAGLTQIQLVNRGEGLHAASLVYFGQDKGFTDFAAELQFMAAGGAAPDWIVAAGGPGLAGPGISPSTAYVDLQAGNYVILCPLPDADGNPHFNLGQIRPMRVAPAEGPGAQPPPADWTIMGRDFAFDAPSELPEGRQVIAFENAGRQDHELFLVKLAPGASAADVAAALAAGADGALAPEALGGISAIAPGARQSFQTFLSPGRYGLLCLLPDPGSGKSHAELGMVATFEVR